MKAALKFLSLLLLTLSVSTAVAQIEVKGIVIGDALGWDIEEVKMLLATGVDGPVKLEIYSPGLDPDDYRAALEGREELGDERYDQNPLEGSFILEQDGVELASGRYAVEQHRWETLYEGELKAGAYLLRSSFKGKAKNAYIYRLSVPDEQTASLTFAEGTSLFDIRGRDWVKGFDISLPIEGVPSRYALYDGDGDAELEAKLVMSDGTERKLDVSESLEWIVYEFNEPGSYEIYFRIPQDSYQYSNTVALREIYPEPVTVEVVDTEGNTLDVPYDLTGYSIRTTDLTVPAEYDFVRLEQTRGEQLTETQVQFGFEGGHVRYVLRLKPVKAELTVEAILVLPDGEKPYGLRYALNGEAKKLPDAGSFTYALNAGDYWFDTSALAGASVEGPEGIRLENGDKKTVTFYVYPQVKLELDVEPNLIPLGDSVRVTTTATTEFPDVLPANLALALPESWQVNEPRNIIRPISAERTATVSLMATPTATGVFDVFSTLAPWALEKTDNVTVVKPATLLLEKTVLQSELAVGDIAEFTLTVTNTGDLAANNIVLKDSLPTGLTGENLNESFDLAAGESQSFKLNAAVTNNAPDTLINTATVEFNNTSQSSSASLKVLQPQPTLSRELDYDVVIPGERVTVSLTVSNTGQADLSYTLSDIAPEWLEPDSELSFSGTLAPTKSQTHSYTAFVIFGSEATSEFSASLSSNGGNLSAPDTITRKLVPLEKIATKDVILEGDNLSFDIRVTNPLNRAITLDLRESPDNGLNLDAAVITKLELEANEQRDLSFSATPSQVGDLSNEAAVFNGDLPAGYPASANVLVKPLLEPERISELTLPFNVDSKTGEQLLIHHTLPANSSYELGSSRLNGVPIADPVYQDLEEQTQLYWVLPYSETGVLTYTLRHRDELEPVSEPSLTLKVENRELFLQGEQSFELLRNTQSFNAAASEGLIKEPRNGSVFRSSDQTRVIIEVPTVNKPRLLLNGQEVDESYLGKLEYNQETGVQRLEYFGLALELGSNILSVNAGAQSDTVEVFRANNPSKLEIRSISTVTDGLTPVEFEIVASDDSGISSGFGAVTINSNLEPLDPDAFPAISGYQVLMQEGVANLRLRPVTTAQRSFIEASFNSLETQNETYLGGIRETLYSIQGSITFGYNFAKNNFDISGNAKGYLETPLANGNLQVALDTDGSIAPQSETYERFPLTGSAQDAQKALESDDFIAARYDDDQFSVGYYSSSITLPGLSLPAQLTALQAEARLKPSNHTQLTSNAYVALATDTQITETITPDGTRFYLLKNASGGIKNASETLTIIRGAKREQLQRLRDYSINYLTGAILLTDPLNASDPAFPNESISLEVSYTYLTSPRTRLTYGLGVSYKLDAWQFSLSAAEYQGLNIGAAASYTADGISFSTNYRYDPQTFSQFGLDVALNQGALSANLNLSYLAELQGQGRIAYALNDSSTIATEHSASANRNQSNLLYEHKLEPFTFGVGLAYLWEQQDLNALGRAGYNNERLNLTLTHAQPFSGNTEALSDLRVSYKIDENLSADASLDYLWGNRFGGSVGLVQKLGSGNFAVSYQLPATDGTGNQVRFGIDSPWQLAPNWFLDSSAAFDQNFNDGSSSLQTGLGVRYQSELLSATLASEVSYTSAEENPFKVVFRSGLSGQIDHQQVISFNANYQVIPEALGDFTVAYALRGRDLSLLTYHTLTTGKDANLKGEIAPTLHFDNNWQLRPAFAYKLPFDTPEGNTYLLSLGGHYYLSSQFGLGAALYHELQPGTNSSVTALSLEGSARLIDEIWIVAGYTLNGFEGLSELTKNGLYIRLELFGGSQ